MLLGVCQSREARCSFHFRFAHYQFLRAHCSLFSDQYGVLRGGHAFKEVKNVEKRKEKHDVLEREKKCVIKRNRGSLSEVRQGEIREIVAFYSPGKTKYRTQTDVKKVLHQRGMKLCFDEEESPPEQLPSSESDAFDPEDELDHDGGASLPSTSKKTSTKSTAEKQLEVEVYICERVNSSVQVCR